MRATLKSQLKPGEKVARATRPNVGMRVAYREQLQKIIDAMHDDVAQAMAAEYADNPPATMALDAPGPIAGLKRLMARLSREWTKKIDATAPKLAAWFAQSVQRRSDTALKRMLRDGGMTVRFKPTPGIVDAMTAGVTENVALIRNIGQQTLSRIEQSVMRSAMAGGDVGALTRELERIRGIDRQRAARIARDQNSKMHSVVVRQRMLETGFKDAIWMHSHGGHEPRPTHVANDGERFNIETGWFDPEPKVRQWIQPGWLINCRCTSRPIIPGMEAADAP